MNDKRKKRRKIETICVVIILVLGLCFVSYSSVATFISDYSQTKVVAEYEETLKQQKEADLKKKKEKVEKHNEKITNVVSIKKDNQNEIKNKTVFKLGELEGYITIPTINVALPMYEGTQESSLYSGVGHISTTSFPSNNKKGSHCVLAGHSAMSSATLFDDLDKMKIGDIFYIKFIDKTYKYKVDKITPNVEPDNADQYIKTVKGKDYCTLLTCTPKTINTHRLLVRGINIPMDKKEIQTNSVQQFVAEKEQQMNNIIYIVVGVCCVVIILTIILIIYKKKKNR